MGGGGAPDTMTTSQDRAWWAQGDAQARMDLGRDFYMPGARLVKYTDADGKERSRYEDADFRSYDEAGGPSMQQERFAPGETRGRHEASGLLDQGDPYFGTRRQATSDVMAGGGEAARGEMQAMRGGDIERSPFASGSMMQNPYLDKTYQRAADKVSQNFMASVAPDIQGSMTGQGKGMGSGRNEAMGRAQQTLGGELGGLATDIYGGAYDKDMGRYSNAYEAERGRQSSAQGNALNRSVNMLPQLGDIRGQEFGDSDRRREMGSQTRDLNRENDRRTFENQKNAFNFQEQQPFQFAAFQDMSTSGTGQTTQPSGVYNDPWATGIGATTAATGLSGLAP